MESELSDLWCVLALPLLFVRSAGNGLRRLSSHDPQTQSTETFVGGFIFELEQILLSSITGGPQSGSNPSPLSSGLYTHIRTVSASMIDAYHTTYTLYPPMNSISFPTPQIPSPNSIAGCLPPISHTPLEDIAHTSSVVMDAGIYQYDFTAKHGHERYPQEARRGEEDQVHWRDVGSAAHTNASIRRRRSWHEPGAPHTCPKCRKSFTRAHNLHDHIRRHKDEGKFRCSKPGCSSRFNVRNGLRTHLQRIHHDTTRL
ncbi:hypothetical protein K525DRAFT_360742 [Schizophyllum commune Loenen D]|nr:hypothetical protein K525DRAFT_360742 [Schizophyllum commune Loenen D]